MTRLLLRLRVRDENDEHEMLTMPNAKFEVMYIIPTRASMKSVVLKHLRHKIFMTNFQSLPNLLIYYSMKNTNYSKFAFCQKANKWVKKASVIITILWLGIRSRR
jgi:hypothetical protein